MFQRRGFKETETLEHHLSEEAKRLREQAELLPPGAVRDATQSATAENGSHMS